jgi:hypothetical protein
VSISSKFYPKHLWAQIPKAQKRYRQLDWIFTLLGSANIKALDKILMKLTPIKSFTLLGSAHIKAVCKHDGEINHGCGPWRHNIRWGRNKVAFDHSKDFRNKNVPWRIGSTDVWRTLFRVCHGFRLRDHC